MCGVLSRGRRGEAAAVYVSSVRDEPKGKEGRGGLVGLLATECLRSEGAEPLEAGPLGAASVCVAMVVVATERPGCAGG